MLIEADLVIGNKIAFSAKDVLLVVQTTAEQQADTKATCYVQLNGAGVEPLALVTPYAVVVKAINEDQFYD